MDLKNENWIIDFAISSAFSSHLKGIMVSKKIRL